MDKICLVKYYDGEDFYPIKVFLNKEKAERYITDGNNKLLLDGYDNEQYILSFIEADLNE